MEPFTSIVGWLPAALGKALVKRLLTAPGPGAGLVKDPVRLSGWVTWRDGKRELAEREITKLVRKIELRATDADPALRLIGPEQGQLVTQTVTSTLMALEAITMDDVQAAALDPQRLAATLTAAADQKFTKELSGPADVLYERLVQAACLHILEFFSQRPEFPARTSVETIKRLQEIQDAIARLAEPPDEGARFRSDYVEHVVTDADQMQLFGLRLPVSEQTYVLSTAYVTLSVNWDQRPGRRGYEDPGHRHAMASFEHLLGENNRVLLEGPAGAGKTTLLRRLALHICQGDLPLSAADWRFRIPFLLRLRDFTTQDGVLQLPAVEDFVGVAVPLLRGAQPHGWAAGLLRDGRAVVLLDGVDELPQVHRPSVMRWLEDLVRHYPDARYVVTSRPRVVGDDWRERLQGHGFAAARLEPMTRGQVDDFIDRWHATVISDPNDQEARSELAGSLKNALTARRDLARLATNPLLCAMLCALNRNSNQYLPSGRVALYDDVLTMLLERRDEEQRINAGPVRLSRRQAQPLLSAMAIWMTINGKRAIGKDTALRIVGEIVPRFQGFDQVDPQELPSIVLDYLVERSGLLQAPAIDQLEFRHSSLQDYLAASEVFRQDHIPHLLRNAHDPLYHDVIIMAVAQAEDDPKRQSDLLNGLIHRAETEPDHSRRLWLLAAACVADTEMVDPELSTRIHTETGRLLPPADLDEADSVAAAGEFVLDLLADAANRPGLLPKQIAGIVRIAGRAGGEGSFPLIGRFRYHPADEVQREIIRVWTQTTDPNRYATEILADSSITHLGLPEARLSSLLPHLKQLDSLAMRGSRGRGMDWHAIASITGLRNLTMENVTEVDWNTLATMTGLHTLHLDDVPGVDWRAIASLTGLHTLHLYDVGRADLTAIASLTGLHTLHLFQMTEPALTAIASMTGLRNLTMDDVTKVDWTAFASMTGLHTLHLGYMAEVDWTAIASMTGLHTLHLCDLGGVDWTAIASMTGLHTLHLSIEMEVDWTAMDTEVDWTAIASMTGLHTLRLHAMTEVDWNAVSRLTDLRELYARHTQTRDISPLRRLRHLQRLSLGYSDVTDVSALSEMKELTWLDLTGTSVTDLRPVSHIQELITTGSTLDASS